MALFNYALPLCDHTISSILFDQADWVTCECGVHYNKQTLENYRDALRDLANADRRASIIENFAATQDAQYRATGPAGAQVAQPSYKPSYETDYSTASVAASSPAPTWTPSTGFSDAGSTSAQSSASVNVGSSAPVASGASTSAGAPVRAAALRPRRELPKLTPQQTLLAVAATLTLIAATIFFNTSWNEPWFGLPIKALVLIALVGSTAFGSIKSKKYFVIISNFLAALSSGFIVLGLFYAGAQGLLNGFWPDATGPGSVYLPLVWLATAGYSLWLGRRFKVFGWLAFAPVAFAISSFYFVMSPLRTWLAEGSWQIGVSSTVLSLAMLLTIVVGRLTRIPAPEKPKETSSKSKKQPTEEESKARQEATYNFELHEREQNALTLIYRICVGVLAALLGFQLLLGIAGFAMQSASFFNAPVGASPDPLSFLLVGLFWIAAAVFIEHRGAPFTIAGSVSHWVKVVAWQLAFNVTAFSLVGLIINAQRASNTGNPQLLAVILDVALGAGLLFAVPTKLAEKYEASAFSAIVASAQVWLLFALLTPWSDQITTTGAVWLSLVALSLFVKAWIAKLPTLGLASLITGNAAALVPLFKGNSGQYFAGNPVWNLLVFALVTIVLLVAWFVASQRMFARVSPERSPIANFTLLGTQVFTGVVVLQQWILTAQQLVSTPSAQVWLLLALCLVLASAGIFAARSKLATAEQEASVFSALALLWILVGLAAISSCSSMATDSLLWISYSLIVFGLGVFHTTKRNSLVEVLVTLASGTLLAVAFGTWTVTLYSSTHLVNPIAFITASVAVSLVLRKFSKVESAAFTYGAIASFVVAWATYAGQRFDVIRTEDALSNSLWATVVLLAAGVAASMLRLRNGFGDNAFYALYLRITGLFSLFAALLAGAGVLGERQSLWLIFATLAVATGVHLITARTLKNRNWFIAAYALALSSVMSLQAAILGSLDGGFVESWFQLLIPVSMLMAFVLHQLITTLAAKSEVELNWISLPAATVGSAALAFVTPMFTALYSTALDSTVTPEIAWNQSVWLPAAAYGALAVVQLGYRLRFTTGSSEARATQSVAIVGLGLSLVTLGTLTSSKLTLLWMHGYSSRGHRLEDAAQIWANAVWSVVVILSIHALLQFAQTLVKGELRTNLYGFVLSLGAVLLSVYELTKDRGVQLAEYFSLSTVLIFAVATWLFRRADKDLDLAGWWIALPIVFGVGSVVGVIAQTRPLALEGWTQLITATGLGTLALFASRMGFAKSRERFGIALLAVAAISWLVSLRAVFAGSANVDLLKAQGITLGLAWFVSALAFAILEKNRVALVAAYATGVFSGLIAGDMLTRSTEFAGYELNTIPVAVALVISTVVARRLNLVPERLVTVLPIALPALTVLVPSTIYSWFSITQNVLTLDGLQQARLIGLLVVGIALFVIGIRAGNLGLTVTGAVPLILTLLPNIWYRIEDVVSNDKVRFETKAIFVALVVYGIMKGIIQARGWNPRTILYIGIPVAIGLGPALFNTLSSLSQTTWAQDDWVRFAIVLSGSLVLLVIGAFRQLGGFFAPGAIGVLLAALPFAWKELSGQQWFIWVSLILVATLLVLVAIRLEQFKAGTKSAANWMRELR